MEELYDVFISYPRKDTDIVNQIRNACDEQGNKVLYRLCKEITGSKLMWRIAVLPVAHFSRHSSCSYGLR
jgi:hypothetical protein